MIFDLAKRQSNLAKHGVNLAECHQVFDRPMLTRADTREQYGEERLLSLDWLGEKLVFLVWVDRDGEPNLISCRQATRHERQAYFRAWPRD